MQLGKLQEMNRETFDAYIAELKRIVDDTPDPKKVANKICYLCHKPIDDEEHITCPQCREHKPNEEK